MTKNYHIYMEKERSLAAGIGTAMTRFAALETALSFLFFRCMNVTRSEGAKLLVHVKTFGLLLDFTDVAVRSRLANDPGLASWLSITEYVRELSGDRNFIAHTQICGHGEGRPEVQDWALVEPKVGPATIAHLAGVEKIPPIDISEVTELIADIQQAVELVIELERFVSLPQPLPAKFSQPIARRRLPRKQRLATNQKSPKRQPSASRTKS